VKGVEQLPRSVEGEATAKMSRRSNRGTALRLRFPRRRLGLARPLQRVSSHIERVNQVTPASRPPRRPRFLVERQPEPTLTGAQPRQNRPLFQVDEKELVNVEAARGCEGVAAVIQRDDVERKVRQLNLLSGRSQSPAIRQQKPAGCWARVA